MGVARGAIYQRRLLVRLAKAGRIQPGYDPNQTDHRETSTTAISSGRPKKEVMRKISFVNEIGWERESVCT